MSATYNGRRGPNVSQYLRDLNAINPQAEQSPEDNFNMEEDLALFTNTQFFDVETGQNTDYQAQPVKIDFEATPSATTTSEEMTPAQSVMGELTNFDLMSSEYSPNMPCPFPLCITPTAAALLWKSTLFFYECGKYAATPLALVVA